MKYAEPARDGTPLNVPDGLPLTPLYIKLRMKHSGFTAAWLLCLAMLIAAVFGAAICFEMLKNGYAMLHIDGGIVLDKNSCGTVAGIVTAALTATSIAGFRIIPKLSERNLGLITAEVERIKKSAGWQTPPFGS